MKNIIELSKLKEPKAIIFGNHAGIIQSVLDFDYLCGKKNPSIVAVVGVRQRYVKYFWGQEEIIIPGYANLSGLNQELKNTISFFAIAQSGRRACQAATDAIDGLPKLMGGMIFAESVPERHALALRKKTNESGVFILGPASVGMTISGIFKIGAIGGTMPSQIMQSGITSAGSTAIISTSGGMINELISILSAQGGSVSFAAAVGGERYPLTKPVELVELALEDPGTENIIYFGELGGDDEYAIAKILETSNSSKKFIAYIAGVSAEGFDEAPQFGHAKALAQNKSETASAKKHVLSKSGAVVSDTFIEFEENMKKYCQPKKNTDILLKRSIGPRTHSLFASRVSSDHGGDVNLLGTPLTKFIEKKTFSEIALSMFLGTEPKSKKLIDFFDLSMRILVDHGPQVSGAVNTMITARAGRDIASSVASGILTIGSRFGGAINDSAYNWFRAVKNLETPDNFVEDFASRGEFVPGIGHKKYRIDNPDPRVNLLLKSLDTSGKHIQFALKVEAITVNKKAQLILNVDGAIAAGMLDLLVDYEGYSEEKITELIESEFFNAIFVLSRTVGLIAHFMEQKKLDEPLFRLPDDLIA